MVHGPAILERGKQVNCHVTDVSAVIVSLHRITITKFYIYCVCKQIYILLDFSKFSNIRNFIRLEYMLVYNSHRHNL